MPAATKYLKKYVTSRLSIFLLIVLIFSCKNNSSKNNKFSFYYWRTNFNLSATEKEILSNNDVETIYTRFFDIDIKDTLSGAQPFGIIRGVEQNHAQIIPVVFITNRTFYYLDSGMVKALAAKTLLKINSITKNYHEIQFDCDWTEKTRFNYFLFLNEIKKQIANTKVQLSATIRLHQIKYKEITGVPPVNRGMLMFYNMGDVSDPKETNSIYNKTKAGLYLPYLKQYTLPLDVALPVFNWQVHFKNGRIKNLFNKSNAIEITEKDFKTLDKNTFEAKKELIVAGKYIGKGDVLRLEELSSEELINAATLLNENLLKEKRQVVFYDLDDYNIKNYEKDIFKKVANCFN